MVRNPGKRAAYAGRLRLGRHQACRSLGVARGKQGNRVASPNQFFGERMNNALGPSITNRRHPLQRRRKLSDPHVRPSVFHRRVEFGLLRVGIL
jgi:hypothetical protein